MEIFEPFSKAITVEINASSDRVTSLRCCLRQLAAPRQATMITGRGSFTLRTGSQIFGQVVLWLGSEQPDLASIEDLFSPDFVPPRRIALPTNAWGGEFLSDMVPDSARYRRILESLRTSQSARAESSMTFMEQNGETPLNFNVLPRSGPVEQAANRHRIAFAFIGMGTSPAALSSEPTVGDAATTLPSIGGNQPPATGAIVGPPQIGGNQPPATGAAVGLPQIGGNQPPATGDISVTPEAATLRAETFPPDVTVSGGRTASTETLSAQRVGLVLGLRREQVVSRTRGLQTALPDLILRAREAGMDDGDLDRLERLQWILGELLEFISSLDQQSDVEASSTPRRLRSWAIGIAVGVAALFAHGYVSEAGALTAQATWPVRPESGIETTFHEAQRDLVTDLEEMADELDTPRTPLTD